MHRFTQEPRAINYVNYLQNYFIATISFIIFIFFFYIYTHEHY